MPGVIHLSKTFWQAKAPKSVLYKKKQLKIVNYSNKKRKSENFAIY